MRQVPYSLGRQIVIDRIHAKGNAAGPLANALYRCNMRAQACKDRRPVRGSIESETHMLLFCSHHLLQVKQLADHSMN